MPLPISAEIHRGLAHHGKGCNKMNLFTIGNAAVIFTPSGFLSVAQQIGPCDMVMVAGLAMARKPSVDFSGYWQRHNAA